MSKENAQTQQRIEDLLGKTVEYYDETSGELARGRVKCYHYIDETFQVLVMPSG
jgi:ribosomal protein L35AE/L33A